MVETYRGTVYPWHCDFNGHMNVMYYAGKFDEATWHFLSQKGITRVYLSEHNRGMVAAEQNMKYYKEVFAGDLVFVRTELLELKPKAIIFRHLMFNAETNELVAEGRMVGIHLDMKSRKAVPFPDSLLAQLTQP